MLATVNCFMNRVTRKSILTALITVGAVSSSAHADYDPLIDLQFETTDIEILGGAANARTGYALAPGDFNGDGLIDLAVSADGSQPLNGSRKGEYYIFWGGTLPSSGVIDLSNSSLPTRILGRSDDFPLFCSLAACDINDDGRDDLFIGTPLYSSSKGRGYLLLGQPVWPTTVDIQTSPPGLITFSSAPGYSWLGFAACNIDFNGDGTDDLAVSAPATSYGEVYVILGGQALPSSYQIGGALPGVVRIIDNNFNQLTGNSLVSADFDSDGRYDLVMGGPGQAEGTYDGLVTILYGISIPSDTLLLSNPLYRVTRIRGHYSHSRLGERVEAFDLNSDLRSDLVASAPYADPQGCVDCGEVYVIYDVEGLPDATTTADISVSMTTMHGTGYRTHWGLGIACGDFNGDWVAEIAVACQSTTVPGSRDTVVVAYGNLEFTDSVCISADPALTRIVSENSYDYLGWGARAAEWNVDGMLDLVLGAYSWDRDAQENAGKVYVMLGRAAGTGVARDVPSMIQLGEPRPNPFGEATEVEFSVSRDAVVSATVYDVQGRLVRSLRRENAGPRTVVRWDGKNDHGRLAPAGVYFIRVSAGAEARTRKVVLVR